MAKFILTVGVISGVIILANWTGTGDYKDHAAAFQKTMQNKADIPAIRAWAETLPQTVDFMEYGYKNGRYDNQWPECIKKLKPSYVSYSPEKKRLYLGYGGGFGHWGLYVAPKGTPLPPPATDYVLPLEDGAWIWWEVQ